MRKNRLTWLALILSLAAVLFTGCSREQMNAQIAESIGTLGMYENNEPVETPKMKAEREMEAAKEEKESNVSEHLQKAERLAASYDYEKALEELALIDEHYQDDDRVISAKIEYQRLGNQMVSFKDDVAHLSFKSLIVDKQRAFASDNDMAYYYNNWALTVDEFQKILQSLYEKNYILVDVHELANRVEAEDGTINFAWNTLYLPKGKKPLILSFAEANYYDFQQGDGFSSRMVLDEEGNVQNEYTDAEGQTLTGAYDVVPLVDAFVEEHPDFSFCGAKGVISVTGYEGVFGYGIETGGNTIQAIADRLKETGWQIACHGYGNSSMESELDYDGLAEDLDDWDEKVKPLVGETDLLIYPYGEEVAPDTMKQMLLPEHGYKFFFGIWTTADFIEVKNEYVRQTRRTLDGYDLYLYRDSLTDFFDAKEILDPDRPPFE